MTTGTAREGVHADRNVDQLRGALVDQIIVRYEVLGPALPREIEADGEPASRTASNGRNWSIVTSPNCFGG